MEPTAKFLRLLSVTVSLLWPTVVTFPITLIQLPGAIVHEPLGAAREVGKEECGLLCKYTSECRGIIYKNVGVCQLITFNEYEFTAIGDPDYSVYIRQFTLWNETEYNFNTICPTDETRNAYMERLKKLELSECASPITFYNHGEIKVDMIYQHVPLYLNNFNRKAASCTSEKLCYSGCTTDQYLIVNSAGKLTILNNTVDWPATCYNGEWLYYSVETQLLYPVTEWRCTADTMVCPDDEYDDPLDLVSVERQRCYYMYWYTNDKGTDWGPIREWCLHINADVPKINNEEDYQLLLGKMECSYMPINLMRNESGLYDLDGVKYSNDSFLYRKFQDGPHFEIPGYGYMNREEDMIRMGTYTDDWHCGYVCESQKTIPKRLPPDYERYADMLKKK